MPGPGVGASSVSPLCLLSGPPPFWVRWRGHLGFPLFLLFVPQLPKTDLEGYGVGWGAAAAPSKGRGRGVKRAGETGLPGALPMEMAPAGPASRRGLASSAVWAPLPGLAGLRATSDADSQGERGWRWGRKANGDECARLPNAGQRRRAVSFVIPPPGGEGF